ncbi:hypothetical protein ACLB2K_037913 [Fragaria x ananassa]
MLRSCSTSTFSQMDDQLLDAICEHLVSSLSTAGTYIVREGDPVTEMLFIIRGTLDSSTTNGGRTGFLNSIILRPGDFCGEELLAWALLPKSTVNMPSSTRTTPAQQEAAAHISVLLPPLENMGCLLHTGCLVSPQEKDDGKNLSLRESFALDEKAAYETGQEEEEEFEPTSSNSSQVKMNLGGGVTLLASRFAANTRRGAQKIKDEMPRLPKPAEPDFSTEPEY